MPVYHGRTRLAGFPPFKGMHIPSDAGVIGDDEFGWLQNMRLDGAGAAKSRGGQAKRFTTQVGSIQGIHEASDLKEPVIATQPPTSPGGTITLPGTLLPVLGAGGLGSYNNWALYWLSDLGHPDSDKPAAISDDLDGTYIWNDSEVDGTKESYLFRPLPASTSPYTITKVEIFARNLGDHDWRAGFNQAIKLGAKIGAAETDSGLISTVQQGTRNYSWDATAARPGGGVWVTADFAAAEFWISDRARSNLGESRALISKFWAVVTYTVER